VGDDLLCGDDGLLSLLEALSQVLDEVVLLV